MRVSLDLDDVIVIDGDDVNEIAAFVKAMRGGPKPEKKRSPKAKPEPEPVEEVSLSQPLADTWNWLVTYAPKEGASIDAVAEGLNLKPATAAYRLSQLRKKGLVYRASVGMYAAGEGPE